MGYVFTALVGLIAIDILSGFVLAYKTQTLSSTKAREGMINKSLIVFVVATGALFNPIVHRLGLSEQFPNLAVLLASAFCLSEFLSIMENVQAAGLKMPLIASALIRATEKKAGDGGSGLINLASVIAPLVEQGITVPVVALSPVPSTTDPLGQMKAGIPVQNKSETASSSYAPAQPVLPGLEPSTAEDVPYVVTEATAPADIRITYPL